jgi:hypothetical protein
MPVLAQSQTCSGCGTVYDPNNILAGITVTAQSQVAGPPAFFLGFPNMFPAPAGTNFQALQQAGRNFALQGHSFSEIGQLIGRNGKFNFQVDSYLQGYGYDFYQQAANFAVGVVSEGFFEGSNLGYLEMTVGGQIVGSGSGNWSPSQMAQWQGWWTAGWNAAQSGNYPVQVGTPLQTSFPLQ